GMEVLYAERFMSNPPKVTGRQFVEDHPCGTFQERSIPGMPRPTSTSPPTNATSNLRVCRERPSMERPVDLWASKFATDPDKMSWISDPYKSLIANNTRHCLLELSRVVQHREDIMLQMQGFDLQRRVVPAFVPVSIESNRS